MTTTHQAALPRSPHPSKPPRQRGRITAVALLAATLVTTAGCASSHPSRSRRADTIVDCFSAPPDLTAPASSGSARGFSPNEKQQRAIETYLAAHKSVSGTYVTLGPDKWAVSFTQDACTHRAGLARAVGLPETNFSIFRAANPEARVVALHRQLTRAMGTHRARAFDGYKIISWGPGLTGAEDVRILSGNPEHARRDLARQFTHGDETLFNVTVTKHAPQQY